LRSCSCGLVKAGYKLSKGSSETVYKTGSWVKPLNFVAMVQP
jgi:hypothetical protein